MADPVRPPTRMAVLARQPILLSRELTLAEAVQLTGFGLLMVFYALVTLTVPALPGLTVTASVVAAGVLGLVINPRRDSEVSSERAWWWAIGLALVAGVLAGLWALAYHQQTAVAAVIGAATGLGALFLDTSRVTHQGRR